jgi:hypothetical protein
MKMRSIQAGDSYPSRLAGINEGQLRSLNSEVKLEVRSESVCFQETDEVQDVGRNSFVVIVEGKALVVQKGMERVVGSQYL